MAEIIRIDEPGRPGVRKGYLVSESGAEWGMFCPIGGAPYRIRLLQPKKVAPVVKPPEQRFALEADSPREEYLPTRRRPYPTHRPGEWN